MTQTALAEKARVGSGSQSGRVELAQPRVTALGSYEIEPIQVHHIGPRRDEGHVGCCDNSLGKQAHHTGHPVMRSYEPGEDLGCCYPDDQFLETRRHDREAARAP
jgi:hypothetical protein